MRVLLAEDQAMVRGALSALLGMEEDIEIVAEASRGDEVLPAALDTFPDVALLDIEMPGGDGLSAAAVLKERLPACRVVILTTFGRPGYLKSARRTDPAGRRDPAVRQPRGAPVRLELLGGDDPSAEVNVRYHPVTTG